MICLNAKNINATPGDSSESRVDTKDGIYSKPKTTSEASTISTGQWHATFEESLIPENLTKLNSKANFTFI